MKSLLTILGLAISMSCFGQQHIYTVKDSAAFVVFYDSTIHQSNAVPKNTMGVICGSAYTAVYVLNTRALLADFTSTTVHTVAPNNDSACRLFYRICFRIDTGTALLLNYDSTTFLNGIGAWSKPQPVKTLNFLSTGSSTYTDSRLSGKTILSTTVDGYTKSISTNSYMFSGSTITYNFRIKPNVAINIIYQ